MCSCSNTAGNVTCSLDALSPGSARDIPVRYAVRADAVTNITHVTTLTATTPNPTPGPNSDRVTIATLQRTDLAVSSRSVASTLNVGGRVTYTVAVANSGPSDATNVVISNTIAPALLRLPITVTAGSYAPTTGVWTLDRIRAGSRVALTMTTAFSTATSGKTLTNTVFLQSLDQPETNATNNGTVLTYQIPSAANLSVRISTPITAPHVQDPATFVITVTNLGPDIAEGVVVTYVVPSSLNLLSATGNGFLRARSNAATLQAGGNCLPPPDPRCRVGKWAHWA